MWRHSIVKVFKRFIPGYVQPDTFKEESIVASSIIEEDLTIEGNISSDEGTIDVKGRVTGDVAAQSVIVQVGGSVEGALSAITVTIEGRHKGHLQCDNLKLASTSQVQADITAKTMTAESGAKVAGKVEITGK